MRLKELGLFAPRPVKDRDGRRLEKEEEMQQQQPPPALQVMLLADAIVERC